MNVFSRGVRNAFRNNIRTFSIVIILGLSIGLSLAMLVARASVQDKLNQSKVQSVTQLVFHQPDHVALRAVVSHLRPIK